MEGGLQVCIPHIYVTITAHPATYPLSKCIIHTFIMWCQNMVSYVMVFLISWLQMKSERFMCGT